MVVESSVRDLFWALDCCGQFYPGDGDLSISFVSKKKIRAIHGAFLGDVSVTDVITFQGDSDLNFAGEIVVCPLYALDQSKIYGMTFAEEIKLYLIHGYLHLCGLEDKTEEEAQEMRIAEQFCMDTLKNFSLQTMI